MRWLLIRRGIDEKQERVYYLCQAPAEATAQDLAVAAGQRWTIAICFEAAKEEAGLDDYEVRSWHGWYRHITLLMLALAFLVAVRAEAHASDEKKRLTWCR